MWRACVCACSLCEVELWLLFFFGVIAGKHEYVPFSTVFFQKTHGFTLCYLCVVQHLSTCSQNKIQFFFLHFVCCCCACSRNSNKRIRAKPRRKKQHKNISLMFWGHPYSSITRQKQTNFIEACASVANF